jgi:hypothetical protein
MLTSNDLQAIKEIVKGEVDPVKDRLDLVENRLETVEMKIEVLNNKIDEVQEDTIKALTDVMTHGYNMHKERIKKLEQQINSPQAQ